MAFTFIGFAGRTGAGTTSAADFSAANYFVAVQSGAPTGTPTDSAGNTYVEIRDEEGSDGGELAMFYAENATGQASHTFTAVGGFPALCVMGFSGGATSSSLDQQNGTTDASSPRNAGSITPGEDNELVVMGIGGATGPGVSDYSIDGGFTIAGGFDLVGGTSYGAAIAYLIQTTATAANPSWTTPSNSSGQAAIIASFKAAAGGGGGGAANPGKIIFRNREYV